MAAAAAVVFGVVTYVIQSGDNDNSLASVTLRTHDQVVNWPNHIALQTEAVATVNSPDGQDRISGAITSAPNLISVEATPLGDPASVEIVATATDSETALAAARAAADLVIDVAMEDREGPIRDQIDVMRSDLAEAVEERDGFLTDIANGIDDDAERAIASASAESAAGVASVLEIDLARLEADLEAGSSPFVAIDDPRLISENRDDLRTALAAALGAFFLTLLGLSLSGPRAGGDGSSGPVIDLTEEPADSRSTVTLRRSVASDTEEQAPVG